MKSEECLHELSEEELKELRHTVDDMIEQESEKGKEMDLEELAERRFELELEALEQIMHRKEMEEATPEKKEWLEWCMRLKKEMDMDMILRTEVP